MFAADDALRAVDHVKAFFKVIFLSVGETDPEVDISNVPLYVPSKLELCVYTICDFCMVGLVRATNLIIFVMS